MLTEAQIGAFVLDGFVRLDDVFSADIAQQARSALWADMGLSPDEPGGWTRPVARLGHYGHGPFREAANAAVLHRAFDQLVGPERWRPPATLGTFVIRFPSKEPPGDDGWHIDAGFGEEAPDFLDWRANIASRGRALLMLFLFSDVDEDEAPTRIRAGSHRDIARQLAAADEAGMTLRELAADGFACSAHRPERLATGPAGTVYLCHPFLVHAGQPHRGARPRFLAQPPLLPASRLSPECGPSPVERAIRHALESAD